MSPPLQINFTDAGEVVMDGMPDAIKLLRVESKLARRLAELSLHRSDLQFAMECLESLNNIEERPEHQIVRKALWHAAIVHYVKCFGNGERFQLDAKQIYKAPPVAMLHFRFFRDFRNKHLVHDENEYKTCSVGAAINNGTKAHKVEEVVAIVATFEVLDEARWNNLSLLVEQARSWVADQVDECRKLITRDLECVPYSELSARASPTLRVPTAEDVRNTRKHNY